jgi:DNA invertase Pin-like site-specific DNA recombinase
MKRLRSIPFDLTQCESKIIADLEQRKINFESLTEKIEANSPARRLVFHVFAALAEFERNLIRERTVAGLKSARGRIGGCPAKLFPRKSRRSGPCSKPLIRQSPGSRLG